jgi:hypothetical protein
MSYIRHGWLLVRWHLIALAVLCGATATAVAYHGGYNYCLINTGWGYLCAGQDDQPCTCDITPFQDQEVGVDCYTCQGDDTVEETAITSELIPAYDFATNGGWEPDPNNSTEVLCYTEYFCITQDDVETCNCPPCEITRYCGPVEGEQYGTSYPSDWFTCNW